MNCARRNKIGLASLSFLLLLLLLITTSAAYSQETAPLVQGKELVFTGSDFGAGTLSGTISWPDGLTISSGDSGTYSSPVIEAPLPFTDVGLLWTLEQPVGSDYALEFRTSLDGEEWGAWLSIEPDDDLARPDDVETASQLVPVPQAVRVHHFVQYRWTLSAAPDGRSPLLQRLRLAFIDGGITPESSDQLPITPKPRAIDAYPKPSVVSRYSWGCPQPDSSPGWDLEYQSVTHVVVHHTVTPNGDTDHAARMRSIWQYHAITRGWGDIGYNYLIANNGAIFEGRRGGDDIVGGHAYPGNYGSMGVSFMGTFSSDPVPQAMLDSAAELATWKADQKGIDPYAKGWLYSSHNEPNRYIHTISGHRDVYYTACPGNVLYGHLPLLRDEVFSHLDQLNYHYVDDKDDYPQFELSTAANWYDGPAGCGYDGHAYYTFSVTQASNSTNWAWWKPNLPQTGTYRVYAYVPYCINGHPDSTGVYYTVRHAGGNTTVAVNQANAAGGWVDLGLYEFNAGASSYVYLTDLASDSNRSVWFDTVKWYWTTNGGSGTKPPNNVNPADASWSKDRNVTFQWTASLSPNIDHYWLRIATDPSLTTGLLKSEEVDYADAPYVFSFSSDYAAVYWGVQAHGPNGYSATSGPWSLGIDTQDPSAGIDGVYTYPDGRYTVHWSGADATSGVATFDLEYKVGAGSWTSWLTDTILSGSTYPHPVSETVYFRVRAADNADNQGAFDDGAMNTGDAILLTPRSWMPLIFRGWSTYP